MIRILGGAQIAPEAGRAHAGTRAWHALLRSGYEFAGLRLGPDAAPHPQLVIGPRPKGAFALTPDRSRNETLLFHLWSSEWLSPERGPYASTPSGRLDNDSSQDGTRENRKLVPSNPLDRRSLESQVRYGLTSGVPPCATQRPHTQERSSHRPCHRRTTATGEHAA